MLLCKGGEPLAMATRPEVHGLSIETVPPYKLLGAVNSHSGSSNRGEAIMLVKLSFILFSNSHNFILPIMLTDFTYYSQNYAWFNVHGILNS